MKKLAYAVAAIVVVALVAVAATPAGAGNVHLRLTKSAPAEDAELKGSPSEIRLWFSQATELSISRITVTAADGTEKIVVMEELLTALVAQRQETHRRMRGMPKMTCGGRMGMMMQ